MKQGYYLLVSNDFNIVTDFTWKLTGRSSFAGRVNGMGTVTYIEMPSASNFQPGMKPSVE